MGDAVGDLVGKARVDMAYLHEGAGLQEAFLSLSAETISAS